MKGMTIVAGMLVALAFGSFALPAGAVPSLEGFTGLLLTPTADALDKGEYNVGFFTLNLEEGADENVWAANMGASQGVEVGFARIKAERRPGETILNAKWRIRPEDGARPALAVGVIDATDELETTGYFVASKVISKVMTVRDRELTSPRAHLGIAGGRLDGVFVGASVALGERLLLMAEHDTHDFNLGARLAVGRTVRVHLGWIDDLHDFAVGASFNKVL